MGIEPTLAAWEAAVLPLNYTRVRRIVREVRRARQSGLLHYARFPARLPGGETALVRETAPLCRLRASPVAWNVPDASSRHAESHGDPFGPSESTAGAERVRRPLGRRSLIRPCAIHRDCDGYFAIPGRFACDDGTAARLAYRMNVRVAAAGSRGRLGQWLAPGAPSSMSPSKAVAKSRPDRRQ